MHKYNLVFSDAASSELRNIYNYIVHQTGFKYYANHTMASIKESISSLLTMPERRNHVTVDDKPVYIFPIKKYVILYDINKTNWRVEILHIVHAKQDYMKFLDKLE